MANLTRRQMLKMCGALTLGALAQACVPPTAPPQAPAQAPAAPQAPPKAEAVPIEMWAPHPLDDNIKIADFVAQNFAPQHPDIAFKFTRVPGEWEQKFRTAAAGNQLPDMFAVDGINVPAYAARGLCAELDETVVPTEVLNDYWPPAKAEMQYRGKTYAVVLETNSQGVRVNVDIMTNAGLQPPTTWPQLVEVGQQLTLDTNGKHPNEEGFNDGSIKQMAMETWCCRGEGSTWMIMPWIWMNGGDVLDDETRKVKFAEEPAVQAIQFLSDLVKKYKIWPRSGVLQAGPEGTWYGQLVVLSWTGAFDVANLTVTNPPKFKWDIAAIPVPSEGAQRISGVGGWLFSAWKQSKHIKETMEFIKFMTTPVWHRHVSKYGYALSGLSSIGKERLAEVPQLKVFLDAMAGGKARPRSSQYPLITEAFQQAIDETIFGDRPVQEALTDATKKIEEAVALEEKE